ncbi:hypothetical protein [Leifsonia sp. Leaf264]|uniref:hypothetical protein n=1 Tax=Leifsonia sp. Leaf264 TaxID=1736314 RepID=UPI0006F86A61|nr:hypothetical protein [Leifsonia sp. Leaf264]KQO98152.1 hypothetical protein ASF30_08820 [Leifsonia sp. Leaf264]
MPALDSTVVSFDDAAVVSISRTLQVLASGSDPERVSAPCHKRMEHHSAIRAGYRGRGDVLAYKCDFEWWVRVYDHGDLPDRGKQLGPHDVMWAAPIMFSSAGSRPSDVASALSEQLP